MVQEQVAKLVFFTLSLRAARTLTQCVELAKCSSVGRTQSSFALTHFQETLGCVKLLRNSQSGKTSLHCRSAS